MLVVHALLFVTECFYCCSVILFNGTALFYMQIKKKTRPVSHSNSPSIVSMFLMYVSGRKQLRVQGHREPTVIPLQGQTYTVNKQEIFTPKVG